MATGGRTAHCGGGRASDGERCTSAQRRTTSDGNVMSTVSPARRERRLGVKRDLFEELCGDGTERSQQTRLGKALQASRDRVFAGFRIQLVRDDKHKRSELCAGRRGAAGAGDRRAGGRRRERARDLRGRGRSLGCVTSSLGMERGGTWGRAGDIRGT